MTLLDILLRPGAISMEFQPMIIIANGARRLYALEALARGPAGSSIERPDVLFEYARRKGEESQIDWVCITEALTAAATLPGEPAISINVHGTTISAAAPFADRFLALAAAHGIVPSRLMLEIVEHRGTWVMEPLLVALDALRSAGVRIAVDDLGVGASNFRMIVDCRPDHLKVDRYLVHGCTHDPLRAAVLASIADLATSIGASAIAEGIEQQCDLEIVAAVGIEIIQGWLFAPAMPAAEIARSGYLQ